MVLSLHGQHQQRRGRDDSAPDQALGDYGRDGTHRRSPRSWGGRQAADVAPGRFVRVHVRMRAANRVRYHGRLIPADVGRWRAIRCADRPLHIIRTLHRPLRFSGTRNPASGSARAPGDSKTAAPHAPRIA